jgi:2-polyprenyl-3-methyl-5-hydroxy-6-metoxy-1,4-benzoquinol methylase
MSESVTDQWKAFDRLAVDLGGFKTPERSRFRCEETFRGVELRGKSVLEIGAGSGFFSAYAALQGARKVVALEPALDGSSEQACERLFHMQREINCANMIPLAQTIQEFDSHSERFDVVLSYNSVNHLDENSCIALKTSKDARERYRQLFGKIATMMVPGGTLLLADCSRYNVFGVVGLKSPLVPTITWELHQTPATWSKLLQSVGFVEERVVWRTLYPLRRLGWLAANRLANFFLTSHFLLVMKYAPKSA